jgi:hypothetical protein
MLERVNHNMTNDYVLIEDCPSVSSPTAKEPLYCSNLMGFGADGDEAFASFKSELDQTPSRQ